ncbi:MAG: hypothetical protein FJ106_12325 [Deltaproteobacteria bacterium]|nr:hypothetical protein [Deltaproteobacteria bacterium]
MSLSIQDREDKMNTQKATILGKHGFAKEAIKKNSSFPRGFFIALILFLLTPFITQISTAQDSPPKMDRRNLQRDNQKVCSESLFPSLTEDQKKELENLRRAYMAETGPIRTVLFTLKVQLRHLMMDSGVPPGILFDHQRKISALQVKLEELTLSYQVKARSVFRKEQLQQLPKGWAFEIGLTHEIPVREIDRKHKRRLP